MATPDGLAASEFTQQRNEALREGVKGLFVMNGGAAVALLAFLQAIWGKDRRLAQYIVWSIGFLALGVFLAGFVQFFRYHASFRLQAGKPWRSYRRLYLGFAYASLAAFLVAMAVVVCGAWRALGVS